MPGIYEFSFGFLSYLVRWTARGTLLSLVAAGFAALVALLSACSPLVVGLAVFGLGEAILVAKAIRYGIAQIGRVK